jgi:heme exporter protein CcmD
MNWTGPYALYVAGSYAVTLLAIGIEVATLWTRWKAGSRSRQGERTYAQKT